MRAASVLAGLVNSSRPALLRSASASSSSARAPDRCSVWGPQCAESASPAARYRHKPNSSGTRSRGASTATRARRGVAQRALIRRRHHHPRAAAHAGRGGARPARDRRDRRRRRPARRADRPTAAPRWPARSARQRRPPIVAASRRPGGLGGTAAGHPDHAARPVVSAQRVQCAFVERGGNGAHLRAGRRRGPQQAVAGRRQAGPRCPRDRSPVAGVHGSALARRPPGRRFRR